MLNKLPNFKNIEPKQIVQQLDQILQQNRTEIAALLKQPKFTWDNLVAPLETIDDRLSQFWSPISHLNSVMNSDELRTAYNDCLPKLSDYSTEIGQNHDLYLAFQQLATTVLNPTQKKVVANALRDFKLSGVALEGEAKQRYQEIQQQLSSLTTKFEENVLDATNAWHYHTTDKAELEGLPEHALAAAEQEAKSRKLDGWVLTLQIPCYLAVMTYADSRNLREKMYRAYVTRASELSDEGKFDNTAVMYDILKLRLELSQLLGFSNYAEYSLATKMAQQPQRVLDFLDDLAYKAKPKAIKELGSLRQFAATISDIPELQSWDISYYAEKLQHKLYHISQEMLRPYFPQPRVLQGMFTIIGKIYGMSVKEVPGVVTWHPDVKFYQITDEHQKIRGYVYMDLYARAHKRGGAWMDECVVRRLLPQQQLQLPVAYLTCNFSAPIGNQPALFTHDEVVTLFHEFGHTLHHLLTQVDCRDVSGINGVPWDAVELPSQFFENWCWDRESLGLIAQHYETGAPLPDEMLDQMLAAKNFHSAMQLVRQLEFALFDFHLHLEFDPKQTNQIQTVLDRVRHEVAAITPPAFNRFQNSFSHIFAGGYAAGYYSYLWAEVLACDAFGLFLERGVLDPATGRRFLHSILEQGGSREPLDLFIEFRGREPDVQALLEHRGVV